MKRAHTFARSWWSVRRPSCDDRAAQLVEFAVSLPLLVVFVVGIFDFSGAFTLKQKLTNVARDAARAAAADPANDLSSSTPVSVNDAFQIVQNYFAANQLNDCGITQSTAHTNMTWTSTGTGNGCPPGGLRIIINRGYYFPSTGGTPATIACTSQPAGEGVGSLIGTCVSIQYAYPWRFRQAASLLGRSINLPDISAASVALNEN